MTDKQKVAALLRDLFIGFREEAEFIKVSTEDLNVTGHPGFYMLFEFDKDGKFELSGVWEE